MVTTIGKPEQKPLIPDHQLRLPGIRVLPLWKEGCPHRCGMREGPDTCDMNEGRPCVYETHEGTRGCEIFRSIISEIEAEMEARLAENPGALEINGTVVGDIYCDGPSWYGGAPTYHFVPSDDSFAMGIHGFADCKSPEDVKSVFLALFLKKPEGG